MRLSVFTVACATTVKLQDEQILGIVFSASEVGWDDDGVQTND